MCMYCARCRYLDLLGGASLGPELRITFESRTLRDAISTLVQLPQASWAAISTLSRGRVTLSGLL